MQAANLIYESAQSQKQAEVILNLGRVYKGINKVGNVIGEAVSKVLLRILGVLVFILSIPVLLVLYPVSVWVFRRFLNKAVVQLQSLSKELEKMLDNYRTRLAQGETLKELGLFQDVEDYRKARLLFDKFKTLVDKLQPITDTNGREVPVLIKPFYTLSVRFIEVLGQFQVESFELFQLVDLENQRGKYFEAASEEELWSSRSSAYEYLA